MTDIAHHPIPSHPIPPTHVHANLYLLTHLPTTDLYDAATLLSRGVSKLAFLPISHAAALSTYASSLLTPSSSSPPHALHASLLSLQSTIQAVLAALGRPPQLAAQAAAARRAADRGRRALAQSTRWPLGLLDDTRQRLNEDRADRARRAADDADAIAKSCATRSRSSLPSSPAGRTCTSGWAGGPCASMRGACWCWSGRGWRG